MRNFHEPNRSLVIADGGMAATSHPLASQVAVDLLAQGGSAVDAAVGAAVLLGLCEPQMTGLGGDVFALIATPDGKIEGLNGSGRAPAAFDAAALRAEGHANIPADHPAAVTIPGAVDAFCAMLDRHSALGREAVLAPAIRYFEAGVPVAPRVAYDWAVSEDRLRGAARDYFLKSGAVPAMGDRMAAPQQALVLKEIAAKGRDGFYTGWVAEDLVAALRAEGGVHTLDDFADAAPDWVDPITGPYRDVEIVELPPNGQGAAALLMAAILERFDLSAMDPFGAERIHLEAEAAKLAYGARNRLIGDPMGQDWQTMLGGDMAAELAAQVDMDRAGAFGPGIAGAPHNDTIYLCVADRSGMVVSLIYSIFHSFGSGLAGARSGVLLQNRGAGFTLQDGHPNEAGPGRRPMHTIIPAMLLREGKVEMPFGVMGGQYQAAGHARFVSNVIDFGLDPQQSIEAPRSFPEMGSLYLEERLMPHADALAAKGHDVVLRGTPLGGAQAIQIDHQRGVLMGASDPRKDGCALGL